MRWFIPYSLSLEQVADRAEEAWELGATEVCMQGGIDPELAGTAYFDLAAAVKQRVPHMHVHAFSPMEIVNGSSRTGLSFEDFLIKARESGLDTIPGTAAEILDDEVRWVLTKGKLPTATWIEIVTTAHRVGVRSSSTMMYGHVDNPRHWVQHLSVLARVQDADGWRFTEFVPLPFVHTLRADLPRRRRPPGPTMRDNLAVHAMARILLHGRIDNIQTSWVKLGVDGTRAMLNAGANDVGGTLMEETISRMAGSEHGSAKTVEELVEIGAGIGRPVVQRETTYGVAAAGRPGPRLTPLRALARDRVHRCGQQQHDAGDHLLPLGAEAGRSSNPLGMIAITSAPRMASRGLPRPPKSDVPPMTAAATENSRTLPEPRSREADDCDEASMMPPKARTTSTG